MTSAVIDLEPRDRQSAKPPAAAINKSGYSRLKLFPAIAAVAGSSAARSPQAQMVVILIRAILAIWLCFAAPAIAQEAPAPASPSQSAISTKAVPTEDADISSRIRSIFGEIEALRGVLVRDERAEDFTEDLLDGSKPIE